VAVWPKPGRPTPTAARAEAAHPNKWEVRISATDPVFRAGTSFSYLGQIPQVLTH